MTTDTVLAIILKLVHCIINILKVKVHDLRGLVWIDLLVSHLRIMKCDGEITVSNAVKRKMTINLTPLERITFYYYEGKVIKPFACIEETLELMEKDSLSLFLSVLDNFSPFSPHHILNLNNSLFSYICT